MEKLEPSWLDRYLSEFFAALRTADDTNYHYELFDIAPQAIKLIYTYIISDIYVGYFTEIPQFVGVSIILQAKPGPTN